MCFYSSKVSENSPIPKFLGLFSNKGLTSFFSSTFFTTNGAAATFFPTFFLGYKYIIIKNMFKHNTTLIRFRICQKDLLVVELFSAKPFKLANTTVITRKHKVTSNSHN